MTDELHRLHSLRPMASGPDPDRLRQSRSELMEHITAQRRTERVPGSWRRPRLVAGTAVVAVAAIAIPLGIGLRAAPTADAAAAAFLKRMSSVASAQNDAATSPGRFAYQRTTAINTLDAPLGGDVIHVQLQQNSEHWIAPDGSGRDLASEAQLSLSTTEDQRTWTAAGSPDLRALLRSHAIEAGHDVAVPAGSAPSFASGIGNLNAAQMRALPTTGPVALRAALVAANVGHGNSEDEELFVTVGDLLRTPGLPRTLRANLFAVTATIPGVSVQPEAGGRSGSRGPSLLTFKAVSGAVSLAIDPSTSLLVSQITERPDGPGPEIVFYEETAANLTSTLKRPDGTTVRHGHTVCTGTPVHCRYIAGAVSP